MKLRVTGLSSPPSIFWMRPFSTVTSSVQESGQSSGHAVRTVECPQVSDGAMRAMPDYTGRTGHVRVRFADGRVPALFDVRAFPSRAHVDAGGAVSPLVPALAARRELVGAF